MDYNNNTSGNNSWGSGIKFQEEKKPNKFLRFLGMLMIIFFSASMGGILGGYYVKNNYTPSYVNKVADDGEDKQETVTKVTDIPKNSITYAAEKTGPAIVGVSNEVIAMGRKYDNGSGSGIIINKEGYIVTNYHVIDGANSVTVTLPGGKKVASKIIGGDEDTDIAVLKIDVVNLPAAKLGDSSQVRIGDISIVIGNPMGEEFAGSVTAGIISAVNREIETDTGTYRYLQTDASINHGNSGGAVCNIEGEVIGISTMKLSSTEGMGFAIPINDAKPIVEELIKNGHVTKPRIGIQIAYIDKQFSAMYGLPIGAWVRYVEEGGPAEKSGIKTGDVITQIESITIDSNRVLKSIIRKHKAGDVITIKVWRDGKELDFKVKLDSSSGK